VIFRWIVCVKNSRRNVDKKQPLPLLAPKRILSRSALQIGDQLHLPLAHPAFLCALGKTLRDHSLYDALWPGTPPLGTALNDQILSGQPG
jgi:hypothetical protein